MAITLLQATNASLRRTRVIQGDAGELTTATVTSTATGGITDPFEDSSRQTQIDLMLQLWQEATHQMYTLGLFAPVAASATITLSDGVREYDMPSDFERFPKTPVFRGSTNGLIVEEYAGGYPQMLRDQPVATDYRGDPGFFAVSPVTRGRIRFDREPTSDQAGETYNSIYERRIALTATAATEALPFSDTVADSLVPVVAEAWQRIYKKEFDAGVFQSSLIRAVERIDQFSPKMRYGKH